MICFFDGKNKELTFHSLIHVCLFVCLFFCFTFNRRHDLHYLNIRLWIGLWMAFFLLVMVALDYSALVCYITRFTEENFATLISVIFIFKAFENVSSKKQAF